MNTLVLAMILGVSVGFLLGLLRQIRKRLEADIKTLEAKENTHTHKPL